MPIASTLAKKTKNEILDEYQKLLSQMEDAKTTQQTAFLPDNATTLSKASTYSLDSARETMAKVKGDVASKFNELSLKLGEVLNFMDSKLVDELKKLEEIQKAIEIAKNILENHHHVQIAANALEILVEEYENKKRRQEMEYQNTKKTCDEEIARQKLNWSREQEEYEYNQKIKQERFKNEYQEETLKKEKIWQEKELMFKNEETKFNELKLQVENFPKILQKEVTDHENILRKQMEADNKVKLSLLEQEWSTKEEIFKIRVKNLDEQISQQKNEITSLKKEQENATKKVQEMAIKVIESSTVKTKQEENNVKNA